MAIKLVLSDIDGTIINDNFKIASSTKKAVKKLQEKNISVSVVSGRLYKSMEYVINELDITLPVAGNNGGVITDCKDEKVYKNCTLSIENSRKILELGKNYPIIPLIYLGDDLYVEEMTEYTQEYIKVCHLEANIVGDFTAWLKEKPSKILFIGETEMIDKIWQQGEKLLGDKIYITKSYPTFLEFLNPEANKKTAFDFLCQYLKLRPEEVLVIGDSLNDLPLFSNAGLKVAMHNAEPHLKAKADYITEDNNSNGWYNAMAHFNLI